MDIINVHDFKTNYSRYLARVKNGETIIVGERGKPVAELKRLRPVSEPRQPGILAGKIWIDDDFDEPMPELIAAVEEDLDAHSS